VKELEAKVKEIIRRTHDVKSFRLDVGAGEDDFKAGQFLEVALKAGPALKRFLSISSSPTEKCHIEFTKKITDSGFSRSLDSLKAGDSVKIKYPMGNFLLRADYKKISFLSGGVGITPIRSIVKYVVDKNSGTDIILLYANRSIKDIVFRDDFEFMQKAYAKLKVVHVLCEPAAGFKCTPGLINAQVIRNEVSDYTQRKFYLCGPPAMVSAMQAILSEEFAMPGDKIITENFQGY